MMLLFLPFLALITVDFARFAYGYVTVTNCARNGAIYASSNSTARAQSPYYNANVNTATQTAALADASTLSPSPTVDSPKYSSTYDGTYTAASGTPPVPPTTGYVQVTVTWTF